MTIGYAFTTTQPEILSETEHRRIMRSANGAMAVDHLVTNLRKHFTNSPENRPGGEYGYVAPTRGYMIRKARRYGHQTPNVFSGREALHVLANARITMTSRKATVKIRGLHPKTEEQGRRWRETVATVATSEGARAAQIGHKVYMDEYEKFRASKKTRQTSQ